MAMSIKNKGSIFIICTVRLGENPKAVEYVKKMEAEGWEVHYPPRDTNQEDPTGGWRICVENRAAIRAADEVHIFYDARSQGIHFDIGMCYALDKHIKLIDVSEQENKDYPTQKSGKSYLNMVKYWEARNA
jgi:hypothetical protein